MSSLLQQKANQCKKLWEKVEFFSFQMEWEGRKYHHVLYQRFNKPTGILILGPNGEIISKEQAKQVVAPMNYYNNIAKGAATDLVREKDRDITPMKDLQRILSEQSVNFSDSSSLRGDVDNVLRMLEIILDGQQELKRIFEELKEIDIDAREKRRFVTIEDVGKFTDLNNQYQAILYQQGKVQQEYRESMKRLAEYVKEKAAIIKESSRALEVLSAFLNAKVARTLDESLKTFEEDMHGRRVPFANGEAGVQQMLQLYREKTLYETEKILYVLLRNP